MSAQRTTATGDTLRRLLAPVASAAGLDLEDVSVTPAGKRRVVRVVVDGDGGVSLDAVAAISQRVSATLDDDPQAAAALGGAPYVLEVSSPGVDRPLTEPRHWRRAQGRLVQVTTRDGGTLTGRLTGVTGDEVQLTTPTGESVVSWDEVARARVEVEFSRAAAGAPPDEAPDDGSFHDADDDLQEEAPTWT